MKRLLWEFDNWLRMPNRSVFIAGGSRPKGNYDFGKISFVMLIAIVIIVLVLIII